VFAAILAGIALGGQTSDANAQITAALVSGNSCQGTSSAPFAPGGSPLTVTLCVSAPGANLCGGTYILKSASAGEDGRFTVTNRVLLGTVMTDPSTSSPAYPVSIVSTGTVDFGGTSGTTAAQAGANNQAVATFTIQPQANATNTSYTVSLLNSGMTTSTSATGCQDAASFSDNPMTASITFVQPATPPSITKTFGAASIPVGGTTSVSFIINNPNAGTALTGVAFTDTLPAGLVVATPNALTNTCGGTVTATAASGAISLSGGTIVAAGSCTITANVTGTAAGAKSNSVTVTSTEGGNGNTSTANLAVVAPPTISKAFGASTIPLNGSTTLTFTLTNPAANTVALTGVGFSDSLPAGLVVSTPNGLNATCSGTSTAVAGSGTVTLTGATLATGASCTVVVNVTGTTLGVKNNTSAAVTSTNGGTGLTASASVTVANTVTIAKAFGAATIVQNGSTSLTFTITNPNANLALTGVTFTDTLPSGLVVATPNGLSSSCAGTVTATAGSGTISLTGGTLAAAANCTIAVNVTGTTPGVKNNSVTVSSTETGTGTTSNASVTVIAPPTIAKVFGAQTILPQGTTTLTFTLTNPNTGTSLTGIGFTDTMPVGLAVATPNGLTGACGGGTITAVAGTGVVSLSGATLAANASCTFTVNVIGTSAGQFTNTTSAVTSVEGGNGGTATASITVGVTAPPKPIPTLNGWMLALLGLLLSVTAGRMVVRRPLDRKN